MKENVIAGEKGHTLGCADEFQALYDMAKKETNRKSLEALEAIIDPIPFINMISEDDMISEGCVGAMDDFKKKMRKSEKSRKDHFANFK